MLAERVSRSVVRCTVLADVLLFTIEALIIRIGFWGPLYYSYNKEPPKTLF